MKTLKNRWEWSQQPSHKVPTQSIRQRLTLSAYRVRTCQQARELARIYRQNSQPIKALETLLSYRSFAIQDKSHSLDYLQELVHLKLWAQAHDFFKVMPVSGYGPDSKKKYKKFKALLSQHK
ncbi:MAG: hypothetical protein P1V97_09315 [Planctomycetota bacterium]|nr:hypothetical protein [Planctomycetota bacterium]